MSSKIDAREVLSYLNQLGYKNIDASTLQSFIRDLKKLMKYEQRNKCGEPEIIKVNILRSLNFDEKGNFNSTSDVNNFEVPNSEFSTAVDLNLSKINTKVRRPSTAPTRSPISKEKCRSSFSLDPTDHSTVACPVHFFKGVNHTETPRSKSVGTACICPKDAFSQVSSSYVKDYNENKTKRTVSATSESKIETNTTSSLSNNLDGKICSRRYPEVKKFKKSDSSRHHTHNFTQPCYCPCSSKPRSAVIKCNFEPKPAFAKCDPVNLHKYYQRQWRLNKIPGENISREQRFRWCIREKISCGPPAKK